MKRLLPDSHRLSVAPMMDWTDRHCRYFLRLISRHVLLYTGMVTTQAILHGDRWRLLQYNPEELPLVLQLGGDAPAQLAECAHIAEDLGYSEVNLNAGCPSLRVQSGRFGACLMRSPDLVADSIAAMRARVGIPVTVKHRLGVDNEADYDSLMNFVTTVASAECDAFIVHARKARLTGLSPKENREKLPLRYDDVYRLKQDFPHLNIEINGGIRSLEEAAQHLTRVDGVMIGRAAYRDPFLLAEADQRIFDQVQTRSGSREDIIDALVAYVPRMTSEGVPLSHLTRHIQGLFFGRAGARIWRRHLSQTSTRPGAGAEIIFEAFRSAIDATIEPTVMG